MRRRRNLLLILLTLCILSAAGCYRTVPASYPTPAATPAPTSDPGPVTVLGVTAHEDPLAAVDPADPYAAINPNMSVIYKPDRDLYNALYRTVDTMQAGLDLSGYDMSRDKKFETAVCLYSEAGFSLFYLNRFELNQDGSAITFTYREDADTIRRDRETYYARLGHLLYNVAPETYTDVQKLMAVYLYICENADYTNDTNDETTTAPYSVLMNGTSICEGFALLAEHVLNRLGVPTEYVRNDPHIWDIVQLDGQWYHTDMTFGAGNYGDLQNSLHTFLMDDAARHESLVNAGCDKGAFIQGFPWNESVPPPPCNDSRYDQYSHIDNCYAVDIEGDKVYFASREGIQRMNLDCTDTETLTGDSAFQMAFYDGVLYYLNGSGCLCQLTPDHESVVMDDGDVSLYMQIKDTSLYYGPSQDGSDCKVIPLAQVDTGEIRDADMFAATSVSRSRSFSLKIAFSGEMDTAADWNDHVYLLDGEDESVPLNFLWSDDGKTLTVRPKTCVADNESVTLYVEKGAPAADGTWIETTCGMNVRIDSDYVFPAGE